MSHFVQAKSHTLVMGTGSWRIDHLVPKCLIKDLDHFWLLISRNKSNLHSVSVHSIESKSPNTCAGSPGRSWGVGNLRYLLDCGLHVTRGLASHSSPSRVCGKYLSNEQSSTEKALGVSETAASVFVHSWSERLSNTDYVLLCFLLLWIWFNHSQPTRGHQWAEVAVLCIIQW